MARLLTLFISTLVFIGITSAETTLTLQVVEPTHTIQNEITPDANRKYQLLFSCTNDQLTDEAMVFYAKIDPKNGELDLKNPVIWRREGSNGEILAPKLLQIKKVEYLFTPTVLISRRSAKYKLNFRIYKPGTFDSDGGVNVYSEFIVKRAKGLYEAYLTRKGLKPIALKQIHFNVHFRNLIKALTGDPDGTDSYWVRVTSEDGLNEYIVLDEYYQFSKSIPQTTDPDFKYPGVRFVNPNGSELPVKLIERGVTRDYQPPRQRKRFR